MARRDKIAIWIPKRAAEPVDRLYSLAKRRGTSVSKLTLEAILQFLDRAEREGRRRA
jgi:hypothetical protein